MKNTLANYNTFAEALEKEVLAKVNRAEHAQKSNRFGTENIPNLSYICCFMLILQL